MVSVHTHALVWGDRMRWSGGASRSKHVETERAKRMPSFRIGWGSCRRRTRIQPGEVREGVRHVGSPQSVCWGCGRSFRWGGRDTIRQRTGTETFESESSGGGVRAVVVARTWCTWLVPRVHTRTTTVTSTRRACHAARGGLRLCAVPRGVCVRRLVVCVVYVPAAVPPRAWVCLDRTIVARPTRTAARRRSHLPPAWHRIFSDGDRRLRNRTRFSAFTNIINIFQRQSRFPRSGSRFQAASRDPASERE